MQSDKTVTLYVDSYMAAMYDGKKLVDRQDYDFTGTQWEKEWLANGNVRHCVACVAARKCISDMGKSFGTIKKGGEEENIFRKMS